MACAVSTEVNENACADGAFDARSAWQLAPTVSLRSEPFGALAYDFHTRKLSFLKSVQLVGVVEQLAECPSALSAIDRAGVPANEQQRYVSALAALARSNMITPRKPEARTP
ncbi:mycofactocin biosynthesis chaperone MftB [Nocardia sp. CA2R105]|nr:mycofactocin biosynthesis chaperone MftB [Nocardia coffeae]